MAWVKRIEGKSAERVDELLAEAFPMVVRNKVLVQPINAEEVRVVLILKKAAVKDLRRARELLSHLLPAGTLADVVERILREFVKTHAPEEQPPSSPPPPRDPRAGQRVNLGALKKQVLREAAGRCEFRDTVTGRVCGSMWQVEVDHVVPLSAGGTNERANLRCLCRKHNRLAWDRHSRSENNYGGGEKTRNP